MRRTILILGLVCAGLLAGGAAVAQEKRFTVVGRGSLTTRTALFLNPNSPNPKAQSETFELTNCWATGVEIRYSLAVWNLAVGLSAEYLRFEDSRPIVVSFRREVPARDGYVAIPLEGTVYFIIPASTETFKVYMGGGVGVYFGTRRYSIAGADAPAVSTRPGFGIHVLGGIAFHLLDWFAVTGEMKFRDLQFRSTNAFKSTSIPYNGSNINVSTAPFESGVQTDGIVFQIGISASF